jgi:uncharacterized RDD family membrane protein YckC
MELEPPDPNALTQPLPTVGAHVIPGPAPLLSPQSRPRSAAYDHRFGNLAGYLLARLFAFGLDVFGVGFLLATFDFNAAGFGVGALASRNADGFLWLAALSLGGAFFITFLCEGLFGTTLGKLVFALHVRRVDGKYAGLNRAFVRMLLRPIDVVAIGPLLALVTPRHQRLGDLFAGTVVGRSRLGVLAPILGVAAFAVLGYAQVTYGGGLASAAGVSAEAAVYGPALVSRTSAPQPAASQ